MNDDTSDNLSGSSDPFFFDDPISQRAMVFQHLARLTANLKDEEVKQLCLTVLHKLNTSIRVPTGELRSIKNRT